MSDGVYVYQFVTKHGSHNQASHAGGKGGAAVGGVDGRDAQLEGAKNEMKAKHEQSMANYRSAGAGDSAHAQDSLGEADGYSAALQSVGSKSRMDWMRDRAIQNKTNASTFSSQAYARGFESSINWATMNFKGLEQ